jgi:DNA-binding cell septation regulator SpoVG
MSAPSQATLRRAEQATWGRRSAPSHGKVLKWPPHRNPAGTMLGFISAELPSGMIIHGMKLMVGPKGARWIAMPSEKRLDQERRPVIGEDGKPVYNHFVDFRDKRAREKFRDPILDAIRAEHPEVFEGEPVP